MLMKEMFLYLDLYFISLDISLTGSLFVDPAVSMRLLDKVVKKANLSFITRNCCFLSILYNNPIYVRANNS